MADTIVVLREGVVEQIGSPIDLYSHPRNRFVASFLGAPQMNLLAAALCEGAVSELALDDGRARVQTSVPVGFDAVTVGVRPEHLSLNDVGALAARIQAHELLGAETILYGVLESGERIAASLRGLVQVRVGEIVRFKIDTNHIHLFDNRGDAISPLASEYNANSRGYVG
jgi:ABC-type sugar transport system ATPase subunit